MAHSFATAPCDDDCADQNLEDLKEVLTQMPVSVCLNAAAWDDYTGGVLKAGACGGMAYDDVDHCVQLVGYNDTVRGAGYWILRNSWSTSWGDGGYIYLEFDANTCGLANEATVARVAVA